MDDQGRDKRKVFEMRALLRAVLLVALAAGTLLLAATPGTTSAKDQFTYLAEAVSFDSTDAAGIQTSVEVVASDRPTGPDEVILQVTRSDPTCSAPDIGGPEVLMSGYISVPVVEGDVRIQPQLRWPRGGTSITFVDQISGTSCVATIDLTWRATGQFAPEGEDGRIIQLIRNPGCTLVLPAAQSGACLTGQCPPAWPNPSTAYAVAAMN